MKYYVCFSFLTASPYAKIKLEQKLTENCCKPNGQREIQRPMGLKFPYSERSCTSGGSSFQDTPSPSGSTASSVSGKDSVSSGESRDHPGRTQLSHGDGTGNYPPADFRYASQVKYLTFDVIIIYEPGHEKTCVMPYANNKDADQPAHPCSLISVFIVRCLDSIIPLVSMSKISSL